MLSKTHTKYIQSLQHKKFRDETGLFFAEGPKLVGDLLNVAACICKEVFALEKWLLANPGMPARHPDTRFEMVEEFELEKISALSTPNQVLGIFEKFWSEKEPLLTGKISLLLDTIQDPGNLGTIIRIADWFGIKHIICSENSADLYNPKLVQSTMGSLGRVNMIYTELTGWLTRNKHIPIYAAALNGKPVQHFAGTKECMLIIGNESKGIQPELLALAGEIITIPKIGEAESLNAAVATGIMLSHFTN